MLIIYSNGIWFYFCKDFRLTDNLYTTLYICINELDSHSAVSKCLSNQHFILLYLYLTLIVQVYTFRVIFIFYLFIYLFIYSIHLLLFKVNLFILFIMPRIFNHNFKMLNSFNNLKFVAATSPKNRHSISSNLPSIKFHNVHGENIRLSADGKEAKRVQSFSNGIIFSNRPIQLNERICIKFSELSLSWSGAIRFGFTSNNPNTYRNGLPKYACPDLTNKPGNWAKALGERFWALIHSDSTLFYYVNNQGEVHFGIDGEEKGVFFVGVDTKSPLWALIDVYGNTVAINLVG